MIAEEYEHDGMQVEIHYDDDPMNPRSEWDHLGVMVCFHKRYNLGDDCHDYRSEDYDSWDEVYKAIEKNEDPVCIYPLYLMDHSGLTISTGSGLFRACDSAGWDWGQVGFIFARKKDARSWWGKKLITKKLREKIEAGIQAEVEEYDQYLRGDVYGYVVKDAQGEELDSCWGFFGMEAVKEAAEEQAKWHADEKRKQPPSVVPAPVCATV